MKKHIKILLILLISATYQLKAQTFPVVSTTQIIPPYSVYLSDYASASSDKLIANLMLQDQNQSGLQVKLKITITGDNGVKLETKPEFMPPPITMYSGSPEQISGIALQQYLEPANMNITGLNFSQFMQNKKLPEGIYTFTIEAVEYRRNKLVSNPGSAVGWLILNDPPIWNLPQNNSTITATNPQNVFFSWLPMHTGSPNSAFSTEFEFSLYDIIPQDRNPEEAVNTGIPIYQSTTMSNSLVYGPAETPLELGRKYAVRLKAYDTEGRDMFKNNGYSTVLVFTYGQECITPVGISHDNITPHTADINWTSIPGNTEFTLYYREKEEGGTNTWYEGNTAQSSAVISQLKPLHTYQYVVKALCGTIESEPSAIYEFTTTEKITDTLNCGDNPNIPVIDGSPPLEELLFGDVINVGGFEGIITQARGGNGVFSGKCIMKVSNFNILLKSHFDDISINQSYQVTAGHVIADRGPGIMINLDEVISFVDSLAGIPPDSIIADIDDFIDDADSVIYEIEPALLNDSITEDLETILGNLNEVSGDTTLTETQQNEIDNLIAHIETLLNQTVDGTDNPTFVMFKEFPEQHYGFDEPDSALTSLYQYYIPPNDVGGTEQFIRWKSITVGGIDKVYARLDSANTTIKFYDEANNPITPTEESTDTLKILQLTGGIAGTTSIIRAEVNLNDTTTQVVGMLNLVTYTPKTTNLVIVPVNGNNLPGNISSAEFKAQLDEIYGVAGMNWNITLEENIPFDYASDGNATFNAWPQGGEIYTQDMNGIIAELYTRGIHDPEKYYLFLVDNPEVTGQLGIMPFSQQYAFVFADKFNNDERFRKTSAHELAHGIFNLEHPYKFHAGIDTFATPNLMTYHPTSTKLLKYQWDRIQNPLDRGYYDAGDEGQTEDYYLQLIDGLGYKNVSDTNVFLSPAGYPIRINNITKAIFTKNGGIRNFIKNDTTYYAATKRNTDYFIGYISSKTRDNLFSKLNDSVWTATNFNISENYSFEDIINDFRYFEGIENAQVNDKVLVYFQKENDGNWLDCTLKIEYYNDWYNGDEDYIGFASSFVIPDSIISIKTIGGKECGILYENNNLLNNNAKILYYGLVEQITTLQEKDSLTDLCNLLGYINSSDFAYYFADDDNPDNYSSFPTGQVLIDYLKNNDILSVNDFNKVFKYQYQARDFTVYSTIKFNIPQDYNANSIDWVKFRATGKKVPYEYSFGDLYKRELYKSVNLIDPIYDAENAKEAFPINTKDSYDQYTACFNTESAIFSWMQFFAEDMADVIDVGIAYKAVRIAGQMFKGGNKKELTKLLIGDIKQKLYKGNNLNNAVSKISDAKLQNYASSLKNSDNVLLKEIEKNADKVSVFSYATDDFAEIAHFEDDFLKVSDNAWADDAIEATKIETIADDIPIKNSAGDDLTGKVEIVEDADGRVWFRVRFIAKSGTELKTFLNGITDLPTGVPYKGKMYRYIPSQYSDAKLIVQTPTSDVTNRFRTGLYLSETKTGNIIEVNSYGGTANKTLYEFTDFEVSNLLDLTDPTTIQKLGTTIEDMKLTTGVNPYEFTQEVAIWAKNNGYSGVKFLGTQGGTTKYTNFVVFEQQVVNSSVKGSINPISW